MPRKKLNKRHLLSLRWGVPTVVVAGALGYVSYVMSIRSDPAAANSDGSIDGLTSILERDITEEMVQFRFESVADVVGLEFTHFPSTRRSLLPEDMGSGVAWGDYDDDGDPDLFLVNFSHSIRDAAPSASDAGACRLYRNDNGTHFTDVSDEAGLALNLYGLAAAWCDYDGDDDLDLYITCYGPNRLMRNNGDATFSDVTESAGVGDTAFSTGCSWADYDRDGNIDLYVCNYVDFTDDADDNTQGTKQYDSEIPFTINPSAYPPATNRLFRNNGDGTFTDRAALAGVDDPKGKSLEAAWFDFDNDGWVDLYVANDVSSNGVFRNLGDGSFADIGASSLSADYRGAMGLAVGDFGHDGDLDLFVTHWIAQENAFFENWWSEDMVDDDGQRRLFFVDVADKVGLGHLSLRMVGWATGFADFDNDGLHDLWVVNGNTLETEADTTKLKPQVTYIFRQDAERGFFEIGSRACSVLAEPMVGRGGAMADFDGDGRVDLVVNRHGSSPLLLKNTTVNANHWVAIELRQTRGNTRALGARVEVVTGTLRHVAQVNADASYLSQNQLTLHFGIGTAEIIDELIIYWPDGTVERHEDLPVDKAHRFLR